MMFDHGIVTCSIIEHLYTKGSEAQYMPFSDIVILLTAVVENSIMGVEFGFVERAASPFPNQPAAGSTLP